MFHVVIINTSIEITRNNLHRAPGDVYQKLSEFNITTKEFAIRTRSTGNLFPVCQTASTLIHFFPDFSTDGWEDFAEILVDCFLLFFTKICFYVRAPSGITVRVPDYRTEMYCASCEV
jgi:hypothetical protein